jgi:hypothetical protein
MIQARYREVPFVIHMLQPKKILSEARKLWLRVVYWSSLHGKMPFSTVVVSR